MPPVDSPIENDLRRQIFLCLVNEDVALTPSELGRRLDEPRQNITYHLNELVRLGLVIRDDGAYYCQPVFADDDLRAALDDILLEFVPKVESRVNLDPDLENPRLDLIVVNCLKLLVVLTVLEPAPQDPDPAATNDAADDADDTTRSVK